MIMAGVLRLRHFQDYEINKVIGKGAYGVVTRAKHRASGALRAIKKIEKLAGGDVDKTKQEIGLLGILDHPQHHQAVRLY